MGGGDPQRLIPDLIQSHCHPAAEVTLTSLLSPRRGRKEDEDRVNTCCSCAVLVFLRAPVKLWPLSKYLVWLKREVAAAVSRAFLMRRTRLVAMGCDPKKPCPSNCHMCLIARKLGLHSRCTFVKGKRGARIFYSNFCSCILFFHWICEWLL